MKKGFTVIFFFILFFHSSFSQENNPLINSGEIIDEGIKLHDAGKYKEAIAMYRKVNRSDTNYVRALYECALSCSADSQFNAAIDLCKLAMQQKTDMDRMPDVVTEYGSLLDIIGQPEKSIYIFDSALAHYPAHIPLYLNKGTTLLGIKKNKEAEAVFQQAIMIDPYSSSCHYKWAIAELRQGKLVPAMYGFINCLLVSPNGRYSNNCISLLSSISKNTDDIKEYTDNKTEETPDEYRLVEKIIQSKIALDKNYKPIIALDDQISRQIQVLLEKASYAEDSKDFAMQYYLPVYKNIFTEGKFEELINHIFSGVNIASIQEYNKKRKKEVQAMIDEVVVYYNKIRTTRELNYTARQSAADTYYYEDGKFSGKGNIKANKFAGKWTFYFSYGNIRSEGVYNDNGEREGDWRYYYMDGALKATQSFSNGKQNGNEKYYFTNSLLSSEANYKDDNLEAAGNSYYYSGPPKIKANYSNGKLNGERRQFHSNGDLKSVENFIDDKLNGSFTTWYKNGVKESEGVYVNGELDGPYKSWYDNGQLSIEGQYVKDKLSAVWKKYYEDGKPKSTETYLDGKNEGEYSEYYESGQLFTKCMYKKGSVSGDVTYYNEDGKPYSILTFDNNKIVAAKYFDKTGKELSSSAVKDKKLDLVSYFADGTKKSQVTYNNKGAMDGIETVFYHCGKVSDTNSYTNGQLNGRCASYYLNGQLKAAINYTNGQKDGYYKSYHSNGKLESEGWYKDDMVQGPWLYYDELGNLTTINYFFNSDLDGYKEEFAANGKKEFETRYHRGWIEEMNQYDTAGNLAYQLHMQKGSGKYNGFYPNGKLKFDGNYVQGDFDGPYKLYFFDGSPHSVQYYRKGEPDSTYKSYFYGGQLNIEGQYKLGKKSGTWKYYNIKGMLRSTEEYKNGELSGHSISYYDNGKINLEITYKSGDRNGPTKKHEPGGQLIYQINYKDNLPQTYSYTGKDGKLVADIPFVGGSGIIKSYYSNGQLATEHDYVEGKSNGLYKLYYPNGKIFSERTDNYDLTNGIMNVYYENGQLQSFYNYKDDNLHGPYKEYNDKGIVTEEGNYYNSNPNGEIKMYNDAGKLIETRFYYYGVLLTVKK